MLVQAGIQSRGDTLIEVLFAIAIFSLVAVGGLAIMNQGTATSQRALEITLVRNEIDAQAETLRFLNASYIAAYQTDGSYASGTPAGQWSTMLKDIKESGNVKVSDFGVTGEGRCPTPTDLQGSFILDTSNATYVPLTIDNSRSAQTFSQVRYIPTGGIEKADGIWIEAESWSTDDDSNYQQDSAYVDFHIRACWDSPGQPIPVTIGTIVRLYEPR